MTVPRINRLSERMNTFPANTKKGFTALFPFVGNGLDRSGTQALFCLFQDMGENVKEVHEKIFALHEKILAAQNDRAVHMSS